MSLTEVQRAINKTVDACNERSRKSTPVRDDDGDFMYWDEGSITCPMKAINEKADKCASCGMVFAYP